MGINPAFHTAETRDHKEPHGNFLQHFSEELWKHGETVQWACVAELGYARMYMNHLNSDGWDDKQSWRVKELFEEMASNWHNTDIHFWRHFFARIIDEIENLC